MRELLEVLLDDKAKRRLSLRQKTNQELFALYYDHLKVKLSHGQVDQYTQLLDKLHHFLGEFPPSADLVTQSLFRAIVARRSAKGLIHHSDRGSQYCSHEYRNTLDRFGLIGLPPKGIPLLKLELPVF